MTLSFISLLHFFILLIKIIFFVLLIISLQFGIGLLGPSLPRMFKIHATFSGALIKIQSDLFFLDILKFC